MSFDQILVHKKPVGVKLFAQSLTPAQLTSWLTRKNRRCRKGVDHGSDEPPKLVPIDEQPNHEIVHALRLGKTNRATHQPFDPRAQVDVLALTIFCVFSFPT